MCFNYLSVSASNGKGWILCFRELSAARSRSGVSTFAFQLWGWCFHDCKFAGRGWIKRFLRWQPSSIISRYQPLWEKRTLLPRCENWALELKRWSSSIISGFWLHHYSPLYWCCRWWFLLQYIQLESSRLLCRTTRPFSLSLRCYFTSSFPNILGT